MSDDVKSWTSRPLRHVQASLGKQVLENVLHNMSKSMIRYKMLLRERMRMVLSRR